MSGVAKGIIIAVVTLLLIVLAIAAGGAYWWSHHGGQLIERGRAVVEDGKKFGQKTDNQGCLAESLSRYKEHPGLSSSVSNQLFFRACLQTSKPTPGFCDNLPRRTEFIKSAQWQMEQCRKAGFPSDNGCAQIFGHQQEYCEEKRSSEETNAPENR